jgi:hypothetical protein
MGKKDYNISMNTQQTITHATGRFYDFAQVLEIEIPAFEYDANGDAEVEIFFNDRSRHIQGLVTLYLWRDLNDTAREIGKAVLAAYDRGGYKSTWRAQA